ncbi:MAG: ParB/Srx family N-terminal domain-containing protein [Pontixanthobacter sp.]
MPKSNTTKTVRQSNRAAQVSGWELTPIADLKPAARRTRLHPKHKRQTLERSIAEQGLHDPITVSVTGVIVDGHLRYDIAVSLGWTTILAIRIEHLGEAELRAYALAANKWPGMSNYDVEALRLELEEIEAEVPTLDLTLTRFTIGEIDRVRCNHQAALYDDLDEDEPAARRGRAIFTSSDRIACCAAISWIRNAAQSCWETIGHRSVIRTRLTTLRSTVTFRVRAFSPSSRWRRTKCLSMALPYS